MGKRSVRMTDANFDKETGISTVSITSKYGVFSGTARVHPEDYDNASKYFGCRIAEMRAYLKYLKARKKESQIQLKTMTDFYSVLMSLKDFNITEARRTKKEIYRYQKALKHWDSQIESVEDAIKEMIQIRDKIITKRHIH